jgi:hypothetical protein
VKKQKTTADILRESALNGKADDSPKVLRLGAFSEKRMRPVKWLVPEFIPRGSITTIAGDGGYGKSSLTIHLAAALSSGRPCLGLSYKPPPAGRVILAGCEDSAEMTVLPRLAAAGADLSNVLDAGDLEGGQEPSPWTLSASGIAALEKAVVEAGDVLAVVIDPVSAYVPDAIDDHKDAHVRRMLRPLAEMAERTGVAVIIIRHLNKSDSGNAGNLVSGSRAYLNTCRAAFLVGPDPSGDDEDRRVLVFCKRNLSKPETKGRAFLASALPRHEQDRVLAMPQAEGLSAEDAEALRRQLFALEWLGETDVTDADLARARGGKGAAKESRDADVEDAAAWLREYLKDGKARPTADVKAAAKAAGIGRNVLFDAKDAAGVRPSNRGAYQGVWHWSIPPSENGVKATGAGGIEDAF